MNNSKGDRKALWVKSYLNKIRSYFKDIINNLKKSGTWKTQLTITFNFTSSKDGNDKQCVMYLKRDNMEIMINNKAD